MGATASYTLDALRLRNDAYGLNVNNGWHAAQNTGATLDGGTIIRCRALLSETNGKGGSQAFKWQVLHPQGSNTWEDVEGDNAAAGTSAPIIPRTSSQFTDGDSCSTQLLTGGTGSFEGTGTADSVDGSCTASPDGTKQEVEISFVIARWYNPTGTQNNIYEVDDADTLQLRLVEADGTVFSSYGTTGLTVITVNHPNNWLGTVFSETYHRLGPYEDGNGNLYVLEGATEPDEQLVMYRSVDDGVSWTVQDLAGRPTNRDLESIDIRQVGQTLHIAHYGNADVRYARFHTSDHGTTPDEWDGTVINETVFDSATTDLQCVAIEVLSTGEVFIGYQRTDGNEGVYFKVRSTGGTWGGETEIDTTASVNFYGPVIVKEAGSDKIHIFYVDRTNFTIYHKSWTSGGGLSAREAVETDSNQSTSNELSMTNAIAWEDGADEVVMIVIQDETNEYLYSVTITNDGSPETRRQATSVAAEFNGGASKKPNAALAISGTTAYLFYADVTTKDIWYVTSVNDATWSSATEFKDAQDMDAITVNAISTGIAIVWDNGNGYGGETWYDHLALAADVTFSPTCTASTSTPAADLTVAWQFKPTGTAASSTPAADLNLDIEFTPTCTAASNTPNAELGIGKTFEPTCTAASSTPAANINLAQNFTPTCSVASSTPAANLNLDIEFTPTCTAASTTPAADLNVDRTFVPTCTAASSTPAADINLEITFSPTCTVASNTPDANLDIQGTITFSPTCTAASTTPAADLTLELEFSPTCTVASNTPDANLDIQGTITFSPTCTAASTTPAADLTLELDFSPTCTAASATPAATLDRGPGFEPTATAASATPAADLHLQVAFAPTAAVSSSTPAADLNLELEFAPTCTAASNTPDANLDIQGTVTFSPTCTAASSTPAADLDVALSFAPTCSVASTTPAANLDVELEFTPTCTAASNTPDANLELSADILFAPTCTAASSTPAADLDLAISFAPTGIIVSDTPDADIIMEIGFSPTTKTVTTTSDNTNIVLALGFAPTCTVVSITLDADLEIPRAIGLVHAEFTIVTPSAGITVVKPGADITVVKPGADINVST